MLCLNARAPGRLIGTIQLSDEPNFNGIEPIYCEPECPPLELRKQIRHVVTLEILIKMEPQMSLTFNTRSGVGKDLTSVSAHLECSLDISMIHS